MPVPPDFLSTSTSIPLPRLQPWAVDVQALFPDRILLPGDAVTVMIGRELGGDEAAVYVVPVGEDGTAVLDLGTLSETDLGGVYSILAVPQAVDSLQELQEVLQAAQPDMVGWQRYNVDALVPLAGGATVSADGRQIEFLTDVDPAILPNLDVDVQVRREGEPLPQAENPLLPGVYDTVAPSEDQGTVSLYAPGEYALQTYAPALAPMVSPYLGAYFTPGEYEVDVTINGVLESTTSFVIP